MEPSDGRDETGPRPVSPPGSDGGTRLVAAVRATFSSLRTRNFRLFSIGQGVSLCGTWMQTVALSWLVLTTTGSATQVGLVVAAQFVPILLLGPWGGAVADRYPKRPALLVTQSASGLVALALGALALAGAPPLPAVYLLAVALGLINVVDNPVRQAFVPEMVAEDEVRNAVALTATMVSLARVVGPAVAGVLLATAGVGVCFLVNGASYAAVVVALALMRGRELHPVRRGARGGVAEGVRYVARVPALRSTLVMMLIVGTFAYEFPVVLPLLTRFSLHGTAATYAALTAASGVGAVLGGLLTAAAGTTRPVVLQLVCGLLGVVLLLLAALPGLVAALVVLVGVGAVSVAFIALGNATLQLVSDPHLRGRVLALWTVAFLGTTPIGGPIVGWISDLAGPRVGIAVGGVAALVAAVLGRRLARAR